MNSASTERTDAACRKIENIIGKIDGVDKYFVLGGLDIATPLWPGGRIAWSARYRIRRYTSRLVDLGTTKVLRRDDDRVAAVVWQQMLLRVWELDLSYRYEMYGSNDTRRVFREHLVGLTVRRWW